jgi:hypothetical protein
MSSVRNLAAALVGAASVSGAWGQVPDLLSALDAGGRAMGAGGALQGTVADTLSSYYNPASLGYVDGRQFGIAYRNLPASRTFLSGDFDSPERDTRGQSGPRSITHLGYTMPAGGLFGGRGTIGLAFTTGGNIDDIRTGTNLTTGNLTVQNYGERVRARNDFYTLSYGVTNPAQTLSWGGGLVIAQSRIENIVQGELRDGNTLVTSLDAQSSGTGIGVGLQAGVQLVPAATPNVSYAASVRTPISLSGHGDARGLFDRIPGRLLLGVAFRQDNVRGDDFLVYGAQLTQFFGGAGGGPYDRGGQTVIGFGAEYNLLRGNARIPLRVGYNAVGSGGEGFGRRNTFTYGIGFHPIGGNYRLDLNAGNPDAGGFDFAVSATYRF